MPVIELLESFPKEELKLGLVARTCYGYNGAWNADIFEPDELKRTIKRCFEGDETGRHGNVFEFAELHFRLRIPIYVARHLVRYRNSSFCERSLRYCRPIIKKKDGESNITENIIENVYDMYNRLVDGGYKQEEVRRILPLDTETILHWKMDLNCLMHVFDQRISPRAQKETREVVFGMYNLARVEFPYVMGLYEETNQYLQEMLKEKGDEEC